MLQYQIDYIDPAKEVSTGIHIDDADTPIEFEFTLDHAKGSTESQIQSDVIAHLTTSGRAAYASSVILDAYKTRHEVLIDNQCGALLASLLMKPEHTFEAWVEMLLEHLMKGFEAKDFINDRDLPTIPTRPNAFRESSAQEKEHPLLEAEAGSRGISVSDMADAIDPWTTFQWDLLKGISALRSPSKDAVKNATDMSGVDAAFAQFQSDYTALVASLTPPS